eukprot:CAMPEP_0202977394 /NCGR_PEP_ID=MMETSP1396-20130829/84223_1 /ASSEMBLY_ACC=CAM_ASM_000872 /TAXON_ID= /ORGANISM="Pseudokeronopsis sp., Strain Brazil" /LENGTH=189 /DNA_ID=CAMNT_0049716133 /DNA_START=696 /DNA_END=1263 /DNA_ORIENTATION=-
MDPGNNTNPTQTQPPAKAAPTTSGRELTAPTRWNLHRTFDSTSGQRVERQESHYADGKYVIKNSVSTPPDNEYVEKTVYPDGSWEQYQSDSNAASRTGSSYYQWQGTDGSYEVESSSSYPNGFTQFYQSLDASTGYWVQSQEPVMDRAGTRRPMRTPLAPPTPSTATAKETAQPTSDPILNETAQPTSD